MVNTQSYQLVISETTSVNTSITSISNIRPPNPTILSHCRSTSHQLPIIPIGNCYTTMQKFQLTSAKHPLCLLLHLRSKIPKLMPQLEHINLPTFVKKATSVLLLLIYMGRDPFQKVQCDPGTQKSNVYINIQIIIVIFHRL